MISPFLSQHADKIESASVTSDEVTIRLKEGFSLQSALIFYVDLFALLKPIGAVLDISDFRTITLLLDEDTITLLLDEE